jgi:hypothetical protein
VKPVASLLAALVAGLLCLCGCNPPLPARQGPVSPASQEFVPALPAGTRPIATVPLPSPAPQPTLEGPSAPAQDSARPAEVWEEHETDDLYIRLPGGWRAGTPEAAVAHLPAFQQGNPDLAGLLGVAGSGAAAVFSAPHAASASKEFADNLTIRRTASDGRGIEPAPEIAAAVAAQYRQLGFDVVETTTGVEIGGLPAASIVYTFAAALTGDGEPISLGGLQVLVAAPAELWILTYTTRSDRFAALRPVFEESARSFRVK